MATNQATYPVQIYVLTFKLLHQQGPKYLQDMLQFKTSNRRLRSTMDPHLLVIPQTKNKTFTDRSFSVSAPILWNNLSSHIRQSDSLLSFKRDLRAHLNHEAFKIQVPTSTSLDLVISMVLFLYLLHQETQVSLKCLLFYLLLNTPENTLHYCGALYQMS